MNRNEKIKFITQKIQEKCRVIRERENIREKQKLLNEYYNIKDIEYVLKEYFILSQPIKCKKN